jgi:redox-sensitive bicupin YhaK (pirin superfamily)
MISVRKSNQRGKTKIGWLDSKHSFSFGHYYDASHMGFGPLRVINEDRVTPGAGFGWHSHDNMEILSYVLEGALEHSDSLGTGSVIRPGDLQRMSAGTGVEHSEFNHSKSEPVHFLQIWILPEAQGIEPSYEQKTFSPQENHGQLRLVGSRGGRDNSITIHQDVDLYLSSLKPSDEIAHKLSEGRRAWLQVTRGSLHLGEHALDAGDGAAIRDEPDIRISANSDAEFLLFDMR